MVGSFESVLMHVFESVKKYIFSPSGLYMSRLAVIVPALRPSISPSLLDRMFRSWYLRVNCLIGVSGGVGCRWRWRQRPLLGMVYGVYEPSVHICMFFSRSFGSSLLFLFV